MSKGILLMCFNTPTYGRYAYNMAHSIMNYSNLPIHLICDKKSIMRIETSIFSAVEFIDFERNETGRVDNCFAKTKLFERSPFEKTLYLDVDGVMLKNPEEIFNALDGKPIYVQPMGQGGKNDNISYTWASNEIVWEKYKLKDDAVFPSCQTSIIYFEKNKESKEFFRKLSANYKRS